MGKNCSAANKKKKRERSNRSAFDLGFGEGEHVTTRKSCKRFKKEMYFYFHLPAFILPLIIPLIRLIYYLNLHPKSHLGFLYKSPPLFSEWQAPLRFEVTHIGKPSVSSKHAAATGKLLERNPWSSIVNVDFTEPVQLYKKKKISLIQRKIFSNWEDIVGVRWCQESSRQNQSILRRRTKAATVPGRPLFFPFLSNATFPSAVFTGPKSNKRPKSFFLPYWWFVSKKPWQKWL